MDFSVFENTQSQLQSNCIDFQSCAVVCRLLSCLSYYSRRHVLIDSLYKLNAKIAAISKLVLYLKAEEYDTESLTEDLELMGQRTGSNIEQHMNDHRDSINLIADIFIQSQSMFVYHYKF